MISMAGAAGLAARAALGAVQAGAAHAGVVAHAGAAHAGRRTARPPGRSPR